MVSEHGGDGPAYDPDMDVRILLSGTVEPDAGIIVETEVRRIELAMLARENDRRRQAARPERRCERRQLDGFRTGSDD
jgi:hypothetical protein